MRKSAIITVCLLTMPTLHGCNKQREEPLGSRDPAFESPVGQSTHTQRGPLPVGEGTNDAPLHHADTPSKDEQAKAKSESGSGREAKVELRGLGGEKLSGEAALKERSNGVEIALQVKNAAPGTRLVALRDTGSCTQAQPKDVPVAAHAAADQHAAVQPNAELGALVIDRSGEGSLRINVPSANLQKEQQGSLLGKALVIYPEERITTDRDKGQNMIACAQILAD